MLIVNDIFIQYCLPVTCPLDLPTACGGATVIDAHANYDFTSLISDFSVKAKKCQEDELLMVGL